MANIPTTRVAGHQYPVTQLLIEGASINRGWRRVVMLEPVYFFVLSTRRVRVYTLR